MFIDDDDVRWWWIWYMMRKRMKIVYNNRWWPNGHFCNAITITSLHMLAPNTCSFLLCQQMPQVQSSHSLIQILTPACDKVFFFVCSRGHSAWSEGKGWSAADPLWRLDCQVWLLGRGGQWWPSPHWLHGWSGSQGQDKQKWPTGPQRYAVCVVDAAFFAHLVRRQSCNQLLVTRTGQTEVTLSPPKSKLSVSLMLLSLLIWLEDRDVTSYFVTRAGQTSDLQAPKSKLSVSLMLLSLLIRLEDIGVTSYWLQGQDK